MNCWILCHPRSGSTYLCDLLNNTNLFENYEDPRLKDKIGPIQRGLAFNEWLRIFSNYHDLCKNPPSYCKAIYHQYIEVMGDMPFEKRRKPDHCYSNIDKNIESFVQEKFKINAIQSLFLNIRFVLLKRDIFEQTVSTYIARQTQKYHIYTEQELNNYMHTNININDFEILSVYEEMESLQSSLNSLICRNTEYIDVNYADLMSRPAYVLDAILGFIKMPQSGKIIENSLRITQEKMRTFSMKRPESKNIIDRLKSMVLKEKNAPKIFS